MDRAEAVKKLKLLEGKDLRQLADKFDVTVWKAGKKNKGWAGHVLERYLGLPLNSSRSPNFGSWELKQVSLKRLKSGAITVKETMAITMIDPYHVAKTPFRESHLFTKLRRAVVCARMFESIEEQSSLLISVCTFNLDDPNIFSTVEKDYELARKTIIEKGKEGLKSEMGELVQPRTKGKGHGSTSRAFYARTGFVKIILDLQ